MNNDDLKRYSVIVGNGSGCIFQPMTEDYTYILTAKHLFYIEKENERGQKIREEIPNGTLINIRKQIHDGEKWEEKEIPFKLSKGKNYFPHKEADIAILKILPAIEGFDKIIVQDSFERDNGFELCGSPEQWSDNSEGERYTTQSIERFVVSGNYSYMAQLFPAFDRNIIAGMSGGGILKISNDNISIIGIQSKMANGSNFPTGQIGFVPMLYFNQIADYNENQTKLTKLYPNYLSNFSFLKDEVFLLEVDAIDEDKVADVRTTLRNKALEITRSEVTPWGIKELFKERLLVFDKNIDCLSYKPIWIAWLEFLTILNVIKYQDVKIEILSEVFNMYRLKYADVDDWSELEIRNQLGKSDYIGLKPNSTVFVSTRRPPKRQFYFPKGKLIDISRPYNKDGFRTDGGLDPFTSFDFVHIDYFKTKCIIDKIEEYQNMNENELLNKLKEEYHELFK